MSDPVVTLIFPPLVETSFGAIYPSTAQLTGYLQMHDLPCRQLDLNGDFADYLLEPDRLRRMGEGDVAPIRRHDLAAACARWLTTNRGLLVDEQGRHRFGESNQHSWTLNAIARAFRFDPSLEEILAGQLPEGLALMLEDFYSSAGVAGRIAPSTRVVGISAPMGPQLLPSLWLAGRIRQDRPDVRIVLGGPSVSLMDTTDLELVLRAHPAVDAAVRYDGEQPLLRLVRQAAEGRWSPSDVPSTASVAEGRFHDVAPVPGPNINTLPMPVYDPAQVRRLENPVLSVTQARGCYWGKCDYCDFVELYGVSQPYRGRRPQLVADEMEALSREFGVDRFEIVTESIPPAFARRLADELDQRGLTVRWDSFAMADRRFDADLLRTMAASGCQFLTIGLESMVGRVLGLVHKSADDIENRRFLRAARDAGISLRINLIPDLPSTTYAEALAGLDDIRELQDCFDVVAIWPFEGTRSSNVGRHPEQFGLRVVEPELDQSVSTAQYAMNRLRYVDDAMTAEQRRDVIGRYRRFASEVNGGTGAHEDTPAGTVCRFASAAGVDHVWHEDRLVLTDVANMVRLVLHPGASDRLAPLLDGRDFRLEDLGRLGQELAARNLLEVVG